MGKPLVFQRPFSLLLILALIVSGFPPTPISALETGSVRSGIVPNKAPIKITIKFWGFPNTFFISNLELPNHIVHEYIDTRDDKVKQYWEGILGIPFAWEYKIEYVYDTQPGNIFDLTNFFAVNSTSKDNVFVNENGTIKTVSGKQMNVKTMANFLRNYDAETGYTIHVIDGRIFDASKDSLHWYSINENQIYFRNSMDLRNLGEISSTSLFYDVNAYAPTFINIENGSQRMIDVIASDVFIDQFLTPRLSEIIEKIIIGSPYYRKFGFVDYRRIPDLEFAKVVIGGNSSPVSPLQVHFSTSANKYENKIRDFLSFLPTKINVKTSFMEVSDSKRIQSFLSSYTKTINGSKVIVMDDLKAEALKNSIRFDKSIYTQFPSGFFYLTVFFDQGTDERVQFLYNKSTGLKEYSADIIGLDIVNISTWLDSPIERASTTISDYALRSVGKLLGLPILKNGITAFLETPMSEYGYGKSKSGKSFSQLEKFSFWRKLAMIYNISSILLYNSALADLNKNNYKFIPHQEIYDADAVRINATVFWKRGNYKKAMETYLIAFENMTQAVQKINKRIFAFSNSLIFASGMFLLFSVYSLMKSYVIPAPNSIVNAKGIPVSWYSKKEEKNEK